MGTGIAAAIPIVLRQNSYRPLDVTDFSKGFFDCFNFEEVDGKKVYHIKEDLLIDNYKLFLSEFYNLIDEESYLNDNIILDANNFNDFSAIYSKDNRNGRVPFIYSPSAFFSTLGCSCDKFWLFYNGSYKAYLEVYETLLHFEKILAKAMKNPLANAIKFGLFG